MDSRPTHIVLGAGGAIGVPLAEKLIARNERVTLVSRRGHSMTGATTVRADLTVAPQARRCIEPSSIVYLVAGLPYAASVWKAKWPRLIENTIAACQENQARLVFLDNVYMYGKVEGVMTEETPVNPCSRKGEVRARVAEAVLSAIRQRSVKAIIARSADFYGPYAGRSSTPNSLVILRMMKGEKAYWLAEASFRHSLTYTLDCAEALILLGAAEDTYNQIWHLPTAHPAPTGAEFISMVAVNLGVEPSLIELKRWLLQSAGLFSRLIREAVEMIYQSESDYLFDSTKFERRFSFSPTPYAEGVRNTIEYFRQHPPKFS